MNILKIMRVVSFTTGLMLVSFCSAAVHLQYFGKIQSIIDIGRVVTGYRYDGLDRDSGHYLQAGLNGYASEQDIYRPTMMNTACHVGQLCAKVLGNKDLIIYAYHYSVTNPTGVLSQKTLYRPIKNAGGYMRVSQIKYHYDLNHKLILSQTSSWLKDDSSLTRIYTVQNNYDALGRLSSSTASHQTTYYHYDANGNMMKRSGGAFPLSLAVTGIGEAILINGQSISYDGNGNQLTAHAGGLGTYRFNARNQLVGYDPKQGMSDTYTYTADGLRWAKAQGNPSTTWQYYNQAAQLLNIITRVPNQTQTISHYLLAKGHLAQLLTGIHIHHPTPFYNIVGHTGSVTGHLNSAGQLVSTTQYAAYGSLVMTDNNRMSRSSRPTGLPRLRLAMTEGVSTAMKGNAITAGPFRFDGEQQDTDTGLINLRARNYDPQTARFISQDSYHLMNRYAFAKDDPVDRLDSQGHMSRLITAATALDAFNFIASVFSFDPLWTFVSGAALFNDTLGGKYYGRDTRMRVAIAATIVPMFLGMGAVGYSLFREDFSVLNIAGRSRSTLARITEQLDENTDMMRIKTVLGDPSPINVASENINRELMPIVREDMLSADTLRQQYSDEVIASAIQHSWFRLRSARNWIKYRQFFYSNIWSNGGRIVLKYGAHFMFNFFGSTLLHMFDCEQSGQPGAYCGPPPLRS